MTDTPSLPFLCSYCQNPATVYIRIPTVDQTYSLSLCEVHFLIVLLTLLDVESEAQVIEEIQEA